MGKGGGGGGSQAPAGQTTTTTTQSPWSGQQPFLDAGGFGALTPNGQNVGIFPLAQSLYQNYTPQYFNQSTVAPLNGAQQTGIGQQIALGQQGGNAAVNSANNALTGFNSGAFLSAGNPYFQQMANTIGQTVSPIVNSQFAANGRYGSGANVNALTSNLTNTIGNLAGQNYQQGLSNMLQSAQASPLNQIAQQQAIQGGVDAGGQLQQQSQAELNDQINRWNFQQQLPYNKLATYQQMVQGNYGGTGTTTQPYFAQPSNGKGGKSAGSTIAELAPLAIAAFAS